MSAIYVRLVLLTVFYWTSLTVPTATAFVVTPTVKSSLYRTRSLHDPSRTSTSSITTWLQEQSQPQQEPEGEPTMEPPAAATTNVTATTSSSISTTTTATGDDDERWEDNDEVAERFQPIFDFTKPINQDTTVGGGSRNDTEKFERIDDVIMGGISSSALRQLPGEPFARWSGICRIDGGGFCGIRTLPFKEKLLEVFDGEGLYITCRLSSDDEPDRRVWKFTTRVEQSRGELLYQAIFTIPPSASTSSTSSSSILKDGGTTSGEEPEFFTIKIPFDDFRLVRGARLVANPESLTNYDGICQLGVLLSKFDISDQLTTIPNFRPGFFELQIKQIGVYYNTTTKGTTDTAALQVINDKEDLSSPVLSLTREEAMAKRPLILKMLKPTAKLFFTEKSQRRKSAMRILTKKRGLTRLQGILFGIRWRARQIGMIRSISGLLLFVMVDVFRQTIESVVRYGIFLPLKYTMKVVTAVSGIFSKQDSKAGIMKE